MMSAQTVDTTPPNRLTMRKYCRVITTATGNTLNWPTWDDTGSIGDWLAINTDATDGANPTFGQVVFGANVASSKQVLVPVQLLQDSAFDLQSVLSEAFAIRLTRCTNQAYTNGTGTTQPNGLIPGITNVVRIFGDTQSGTTDLNSLGVNALANAIAALDPDYRLRAMFTGNQSTFDAMRKLKDSLGRPWLTESASSLIPAHKLELPKSIDTGAAVASPSDSWPRQR